MKIAPQEIILSTRTLKLAARAYGSIDDTPLLALHGWLDNAASFAGLAPLLEGFRVVALDLPGHGRSDHRPPGAAYHFIDYVYDVLNAADALGWERFALLGHSLGAGIAAFVAAVAPERIMRLALIEGFGPRAGDPLEAPTRLMKALAQARALAAKRVPVYRDLQAAAAARAQASGLNLAAAVTLAERGTQTVPGGVGWRSDPRLTLLSPLYLTESQVLAFLGAIRAPTLLIRAESGLLREREGSMAERYRCVERLRIIDLPGSHHLHLEDPAPTARVLSEFFRV